MVDNYWNLFDKYQIIVEARVQDSISSAGWAWWMEVLPMEFINSVLATRYIVVYGKLPIWLRTLIPYTLYGDIPSLVGLVIRECQNVSVRNINI